LDLGPRVDETYSKYLPWFEALYARGSRFESHESAVEAFLCLLPQVLDCAGQKNYEAVTDIRRLAAQANVVCGLS
jgi:hypothetical protein